MPINLPATPIATVTPISFTGEKPRFIRKKMSSVKHSGNRLGISLSNTSVCSATLALPACITNGVDRCTYEATSAPITVMPTIDAA